MSRRPILALLVFAFVSLPGANLAAQNSTGSLGHAQQPAMPLQLHDPTLPEAQPSLDVDRDPVPSPDPDVVQHADATLPPGAAAAGGPLKRQDGTYVLHADVDEVLLNCTVIDGKGQTVNDLHQGDFRVWEDGVEQKVTSLQHQDLPVSMGILVDDSGSMLDKRAAANMAAMHLLMSSNPRDAVFIVNFSEKAYLDQGFTSNLVALDRGLSRVSPKGTTALYDAVAASADELATHAKERKQALLIITDGADNASELTLEQTIRRVQNLGGPVVYTIGLLFDTGRTESDRARDALERLSQETGGVAYFPSSLENLDTIAQQVARDIRNQYIVSYHSSRPMSLGGYRSVRVEAQSPEHRNLNVRTKRGYFAGTAQPAQTAQAKP
ncbi:MAG TPA: VWA domain-containing protein [Terracidiphilus sp.]|jgi:VWFA-related protein|nr:VWA domain-containing protein [Terracidiphilus sp.]